MTFRLNATALLMVAFCHFAVAQSSSNDLNIIPQPNQIRYTQGSFTFSQKTKIYIKAKQDKAFLLFNDQLKRRTGYSNTQVKYDKIQLPKLNNAVVIQISEKGELPEEGYSIKVEKNVVVIRGRGAGLFYGYQTFLQLFSLETAGSHTFPCMKIEDQPRFGHRGFMLDVARHFFSVAEVKRVIDLMAGYKLNTFHWHLVDSEGWRIEIKKYPKLTSVGAFRNNQVMFGRRELLDTAKYGGFYTQDEVRDVVKYASERNVTIIPEIEMPAHSHAALRSYPEYRVPMPEKSADRGAYDIIFNPSPETFKFLEDILTEVTALFPCKYIHVGGDEANKIPWKESAYTQKLMKDEGLKDVDALQSYFMKRMEKFLNSKGKTIIGWDEILEGGAAPNAVIMSWRGEEGGLAAAKLKHDVIMVPLNKGLYLDFSQSGSVQEPFNIGGRSTLSQVYHYNPLPAYFSEEEKKHVLGVQANLWTEFIGTSAKMEYMLFPRLLALAEIAWTMPAQKNYLRFSKKALPVHLAMLEKKDVNFRVTEAFNVLDTTMIGERFNIKLNAEIPGSTVYYTVNGLTPSNLDFKYKTPLEFSVPLNEKREIKSVVITDKGKRSLVNTILLHNRPALQALEVTNPIAGFSYRLMPGAFHSVDELEGAKVIETGVAESFDLNGFKQKHDVFGVIYEGYLKVDTTGVYNFSVLADDGMKLFIDDELVVDNDLRHAATERQGSVPLAAGFHKVRLKYFDAGEAFTLKVSMRLNNGIKKPLPLYQIFHNKISK